MSSPGYFLEIAVKSIKKSYSGVLRSLIANMISETVLGELAPRESMSMSSSGVFLKIGMKLSKVDKTSQLRVFEIADHESNTGNYPRCTQASNFEIISREFS